MKLRCDLLCEQLRSLPVLKRGAACLCRLALCLLSIGAQVGDTATYADGAESPDSNVVEQAPQIETSPPKTPRITPYPDTPVWNDTIAAAKEFPGFEFVGEYVREGQALQVTPSAGRFYVSTYEGGLPGAGWDGGTVHDEWVDANAITTRLLGWQKIDRSKEVVGKQPPPDAIILFDGSNTDAWRNGQMEAGFLKAGARTKRKFSDFTLYLEFLVPLKPEPPISHPHRGNSGILALGAYEVQIVDSFGLDLNPSSWESTVLLKPADTWCGSIYGIRAPVVNACLPPLAWQSLEVDFTAARFENNKKVSPALVSVVQNGVKIHDNVSLPRGTGGGPSGPRPEVAEGPLVLQNHGNPNLFRNIWVVPR